MSSRVRGRARARLGSPLLAALIAFACGETEPCPRGTIRSGGRCVATDADSDTDGDRECDGDDDCAPLFCDDGECVGCRDDGDGTDPGCTAVSPHCDESTRDCERCIESSHCTDPAASRCEPGDRECVPCEDEDDCAHVPGRGICGDGECVECTVADESACDESSCDPATHECTETPRGSVHACEGCVADSECAMDHRCVPMEFLGVPLNGGVGGYCLRIAATGCERPFPGRVERASLSGAAAEEYCSPFEDVTTCDAFLDNLGRTQCEEDGDCGVDGLDDGLCRPLPEDWECTYSCDDDAQCPIGRDCGLGHCGGA